MSIKDLFNTKIVTQGSLNSTTSSVESPDLIKEVNEKNRTFFPNVNFSDPATFVHFGSAKEYYQSGIARIYETYPYDGSEAERLRFENESTYLDKWLLDNKYPKSTGYALFSADGWGTVSSTIDQYAIPSSVEYVYSAGGMHSASLNQHSASDPIANHNLRDVFDLGVKYDTEKNRTINYRMNMAEGLSIQFWLKKDAFNASVDKEVLLDLWNGELSSSAHYGRLTLELSGGAGTPTTGSALYLTVMSGASGIINRAICSASYNAAAVADGNWMHHTVTVKTNSTNLDVRYFQNGLLNRARTLDTTIALGEIPNNINAYIGALQTSAQGIPAARGSMVGGGKLSGSMDDFRYWKKALDDRYIYNTWYWPIGGGNNTDDFRTDLGVYYKFNEGITGTGSYDNIVLDYSGRVSNGLWIGYDTYSRNTGSAFSDSGVVNAEPGDPIIRAVHPQVVSLVSEMGLSGSNFDRSNGSNIYNSLPAWLREEDEENNNIKYLYQILSSYLDTLYVQIGEIPKLKDKNYFSASAEPYFFVDRFLNERGLMTPNSFVDGEVIEYFWDRNESGVHFEQSIEKTKRLIYNNIYNNLDFILKSKGTEKSFRNLLRCYGVDDELIKLNVYSDNGKHYLKDRYKNSSVKTKVLNLNKGNRVNATVFQTTSSLNSRSFISASGDFQALERFSAFSIEAGVTFPKKKKFGEAGYYGVADLSSSLFGFHQAFTGSNRATAPTAAEKAQYYGWNNPDDANVQVYVVKDAFESERVKFVLKNTDNSIYAESEFYDGVYNAQRWNFQLCVKPEGYPFAGSFASGSDISYHIELYGVTHDLGQIKHQFTIAHTSSFAVGKQILSSPKRVYMGAHRTDFTGSVLTISDVVFDSARVWMDRLDAEAIQQHNLDPLNYGHNKIYDNTTAFNSEISQTTQIPAADSLVLHWNFDQNTAADANGEFVVEDFSSGSSDNQYGWASNVIERENKGIGFGFPANDSNPVKTEMIFARRKELPEISFTDDRILISGKENELFIEDEDTTDNVFALEKSMYQAISDEMLRTFSTMKEYANLFAKPVDAYRLEYKKLRTARGLFFNRVNENPNLDKFVSYFKWIDSSLSYFIEQLKPASVTFTNGISDVVENHIFERPKYERKFPALERKQATQGTMKTGAERRYNWKFGHAPIMPAASGSVTLNNTGISNFFDTVIRITDTNGTLKRYILKNAATSDTGTTVSLNPGDGSVAHVIVGVQGLTYITAVDQLVNAITSTNGHDNSIKATNLGGGVLSLVQRVGGSGGNVTIVAQQTYVDGSTLWEPYGIGSTLGFGGGDSKENTNCLWQRERAERTDSLSTVRNSIRDVVTTETEGRNYYLGDNKTLYLQPTYVTRRFSRPYRLDVKAQSTIHGGINYNQNKNRDFVFDVTRPHGTKTNLGVPVNVFVIGVGPGQGIVNTRLCDDQELPNAAPEYNFTMIAGKDSSNDGSQPATASLEYQFRVKGHLAAPFNLVSGNIDRGANKNVFDNFSSSVVLTNLHSDTTYFQNDIPMQGPFADTWVGGHQSRHVEVNKYDSTRTTPNKLDGELIRPEAWRLLTGEHPDETVQDGAMGFVGPDYGGPYPDPSRKWAIYYRDFRVKRPYNIANVSGSERRVGNYKEKYEYVNIVGRSENNSRLKKANSELTYQFSGSFLPAQIQADLPDTTHPLTLFTIAASGSGNVFGTGESNRLNDNLEVIVDAVSATGSFEVTSSSVFAHHYSGSFTVQGVPKAAINSVMSWAVVTGSTLTDGNLLQITSSATGSLIEVDTNGSVRADTDITVETYRRALKATSTNQALILDSSHSGIGTGDFSLSFWHNNVNSDTSNNTGFFFKSTGNNTRHQLNIDDDFTIIFENEAGTTDTATFNVNSATSLGGTWNHYLAVFPVSDLSSGSPKLYLNGAEISGTGFSAIGGTTPDISNLTILLDDQNAFQDVVLWDLPLTSSESISQLYNGGVWRDPTTHTSASFIIDYYKFGEEDDWRPIGYQVGDSLDKFGGSITRTISSSFGTGGNDLTFTSTYDEDITFMVGKGARENLEIWNGLTASLDTVFTGYKSSFISGSENAQFFLRKDASGAATAHVFNTGTSFSDLHSNSGSAAAASTLKNGDKINLGASQVLSAGHTTFTTVANATFRTTVNASDHRKALHWKTTSNAQVYASNTTYTNPDADSVTISFWIQYDQIDSATEHLVVFTDSSDNVAVQLKTTNDDLTIRVEESGGAIEFIYNNILTASEWKHYTIVINKTLSNNVVFYIDGEVVSGTKSGSQSGTLRDIDKIYIGDGTANNAAFEAEASFQDFVIWNTGLTAEDASVLYNSGSWFDIYTHASASSISDWWLFGEEATIGQSSGSALSSGTAVTSVDPEIGTHTLDFNSNSDIFVTTGIAETLVSDDTLWTNAITSMILGNQGTVPEFNGGAVSFTRKTNLFEVTSSGTDDSDVVAFSLFETGSTFAITDQIERGGIKERVHGAVGIGSNLLFGSNGQASPFTTFSLSSTATAAVPFSYNAGSDVYTIYTSASSDAVFWSRLSGAIFDRFPDYEVYVSASTPYAKFFVTGAQNTQLFVGGVDESNRGLNEDDAFGDFRNLLGISGGVDQVLEKGLINVIERESDFLTGSTRNRTVITSRFSAPGGVEVQTYGYLDAYAREYSVHNCLNYRNLSVRGSGSGESGTIRVDSHLSTRDGLRTLYQRHAAFGGLDSVRSTLDSSDYEHQPSFHKVPRNTLVTPRSGAVDVQIVERHNNYNYNSTLPASDYNYSWTTSSLGDNYSVRSGTQKIFGYWPKDGLNRVDNVLESAITFPSASEIYGE